MTDPCTLVITGTRAGRDDADARFLSFCGTYFRPTRVILGCAAGVDTQARMFFMRMHTVEVEIKRAIWRKNNVFNPYAGHDRNQEMIDAAPPGAHLLALPLWIWPEPNWKACPGTYDCYKRGLAKGLICHLE